MTKWHKPWRTKAFGAFIAIYTVLMITFRCSVRGMVGFYELWWACNSALVIASFGMLTLNARLIAVSVGFVALAHMLWIFDVGTYLLFGFFPVGSAKYIIWPNTANWEIIMTLHHLWTIPLCMITLHKNGDLSWGALRDSAIGSCILGWISAMFSPVTAVLPDGTTKYVNINMAHEAWKDLPSALHAFNPPNAPWFVYFVAALSVLNILNGSCYIILMGLYRIIFTAKPDAPTKTKSK